MVRHRRQPDITDPEQIDVSNITNSDLIARVGASLGNSGIQVADAQNAVTNSHIQGTDQFIDQGGLNETTAAEIRNAATLAHAQQHTFDSLADHDFTTITEDSPLIVKADALTVTSYTEAQAQNAVNLSHTQNTDIALDQGQPNEVTAVDVRLELDGYQAYTVVTGNYIIDSGLKKDRFLGVNPVGNAVITFPDNPQDGRVIYFSRFDSDPSIFITLIPGVGDSISDSNLPIRRNVAYRYISAFSIWSAIIMNFNTQYSIPNDNDNALTDGDYLYWDSTVDGLVVGRNEWSKTTAPTVNDDASQGFVVGVSKWFRTDTFELFICLDNTIGAAQWGLDNGGKKQELSGPGNINITQIGTYHVNTAGGLTELFFPSISSTGIEGSIIIKRVGAGALAVWPDPAEGIENIVIGGADGLADGESVKYVPWKGLGRWKRFT